jgi:hypothetical protein
MTRLILWLQLYAKAILIDGCDKCLEVTNHPKAINRIIETRMSAKRELHRLKGRQRDLGMRNRWEMPT